MKDYRMKTIGLIISMPCFILLLTVSCKKKAIENVETPAAQGISDPELVNGLFQSFRQFTFFNDTLKQQSGSANGILYNSLVEYNVFDATKGIDVGSIQVNTLTLQKVININVHPNSYFFYDSLNTIINKPCSWSIAGKNSFLPLTINDDSNFPSYTGYKDLPDTIDLEKSNTILITDYFGAEHIEITVRGVSSSVTKIIRTPKNQAIFDIEEIAQLDVQYGVPVDIYLTFTKTDFKYFGGKVYQLNTNTSLIKHCGFKKTHH